MHNHWLGPYKRSVCEYIKDVVLQFSHHMLVPFHNYTYIPHIITALRVPSGLKAWSASIHTTIGKREGLQTFHYS